MIESEQIRIWVVSNRDIKIGQLIKIESIYMSIVSYSYPEERKDNALFTKSSSFILDHSSIVSPVLQELYGS